MFPRDIFFLVFSHLSLYQVLKYRLVSKEWKNTIDFILSNNFMFRNICKESRWGSLVDAKKMMKLANGEPNKSEIVKYNESGALGYFYYLPLSKKYVCATQLSSFIFHYNNKGETELDYVYGEEYFIIVQGKSCHKIHGYKRYIVLLSCSTLEIIDLGKVFFLKDVLFFGTCCIVNISFGDRPFRTHNIYAFHKHENWKFDFTKPLTCFESSSAHIRVPHNYSFKNKIDSIYIIRFKNLGSLNGYYVYEKISILDGKVQFNHRIPTVPLYTIWGNLYIRNDKLHVITHGNDTQSPNTSCHYEIIRAPYPLYFSNDHFAFCEYNLLSKERKTKIWSLDTLKTTNEMDENILFSIYSEDDYRRDGKKWITPDGIFTLVIYNGKSAIQRRYFSGISFSTWLFNAISNAVSDIFCYLK